MLIICYLKCMISVNNVDLEERVLIVLDNITTNIGIDGAAYGQYLDMLPKY